MSEKEMLVHYKECHTNIYRVRETERDKIYQTPNKLEAVTKLSARAAKPGM